MKGINYTSIGYNFLQLTINSIEELEKQGNKRSILVDTSLNDEDSWLEYEKRTKWNDQNIAIPVLFNFFHGVELMLKGLVIKCGGQLKNKTHKLSGLLLDLKQTPNPPSKGLLRHFEKILTESGFEDFFESNNTTIDAFYELFKYPEFKNGDEIKFYLIRGKKQAGIDTFTKIKDLAVGVKTEIKLWLTEEV